jgi:hypothetical protein
VFLQKSANTHNNFAIYSIGWILKKKPIINKVVDNLPSDYSFFEKPSREPI